MADYTALRAKAKEHVSVVGDLGSKRYAVAVLWHFQDPWNAKDHEDFMWVKAASKTLMEKITENYLSQEFADELRPEAVHLIFEGDIVGEGTQIKDLNTDGDRFILLRAIDAKSPEAAAFVTKQGNSTRAPLLPVNRQLSTDTSKPSPELDTLTPNKPTAPISTPLMQDENSSSAPPQHKYHAPLMQLPAQEPLIQLARQPTASPISALPPHIKQEHTRIASLNSSGGDRPYAFTPTQHGPNGGSLVPIPVIKPDADMADRSPSPEVELPAQDFLTTSDSQVEETDDFNVNFVQDLLKDEKMSTEQLENAVRKGLNVLTSIRTPIQAHPPGHPDTVQWLQQIDILQTQAKTTRTVVGVVGNTGAGKSSVINALLDEERLVPTNCMRACTAVVTEISWNSDSNPHRKYKADIEFITSADWEKELKILFNDMCDEEGEISRDCSNPETDAGVAYAKIKAVYPQLTKEQLVKTPTSALLNDYRVRSILGTTKKLCDGLVEPFYRGLQKYVDSNEKEDKKKEKEKRKKGEKKPMEYWPLIKVVRLFTRADALSTGAVLVDLPGVQDSNAARAAVADGYMKQCSGLWIVAPITRAVNDKAAKKLLGDQFRRQMKYDGMFSNVTFICSKTDDISVTEATDALNLEDQVSGSWEKIEELEKEVITLKQTISEHNQEKEDYGQVFDDQDALYEVWERLAAQCDDGKQVYAPTKKSKKRKRGTGRLKSNKRVEWDDSDIESDAESSDEESDMESDEAQEEQGEPLTSEQIQKKLDEIRKFKKEARQEKLRIGKVIDGLKSKMKGIAAEINNLEAEINAVCIAGRNEYSRGQIQDDYAQGIKELDHENAIEEDEENFDPDVEVRDYEKLAKSLPVFCVSSRAYQKLCGRLKKDAKVTGFEDPGQTEMPQLQTHCKRLTEASRASSCRIFLNNFSHLLLSLRLWAGNDGSGIKLTDEQHRSEVHYVTKRLKELESGLDKAVASSIKDIKETLSDNIFDHYPVALERAEAAAPNSAQAWGAHRSLGGLYWATYKAICRRAGGPFREHDFNRQLGEPIEKYMVTGWEKCFQRRMPLVLRAFNKNMVLMLNKFHKTVEERARGRGVGIAGLNVLAMKLQTWDAQFATLSEQLNAIITEKQKEANRELTPLIAAAMEHGYDLCVNECGKGSYMRMKGHMVSHVNQVSITMFQDAAQSVRINLKKMCGEVEQGMANNTDAVYQDMRKDYMNVIAGVKLPEGYVMPKSERTMREKVAALVKGAEQVFLDGKEEDVADDTLAAEDGVAVEDDTAASESSPVKDENRDNDESEAKAFESAAEDAPMPDIPAPVEDESGDPDFEVNEAEAGSQSTQEYTDDD